MSKIWTELKISARAVLGLAVLTGVLYPMVVWLAAQALFPGKANGSLIVEAGTVAGSEIIGQSFTAAGYFHSRPSAAGAGYDGTASGGSNLGPLSKKLTEEIERRASEYRLENRLDPGTPVPADAVTASASGLDPHISLRNALLQAGRVAEARKLGGETVFRLIRHSTEGRDLGILGEPRVNVLKLNLALDRLGR